MPGKKKKKPAARRKKPARKEKPRRPRLLRRPEPEPVAAAPVQARATAHYVRLSPQKARLVVDLIRGQNAGAALNLLHLTNKRAARPIEKVLRSAIANAEQKSETLDVDRLYVNHAVVNEGPRWKRLRPAPYGRAYIYQRRTSHIEISVAERGVPPSPTGRTPAAAAGGTA